MVVDIRLHGGIAGQEIWGDVAGVVEAPNELRFVGRERQHGREQATAIRDELVGPLGDLSAGRREIRPQVEPCPP